MLAPCQRRAPPAEAGPTGRPGTVDPAEVDRFNRLARDWWDPNGPMRPLHRINPLRLAFIRDERAAISSATRRSPSPSRG
jgi:2-polyprenyl-6-hydroxyphenyl methylase/3-demethylubiquinone-9 3-methyltransferase